MKPLVTPVLIVVERSAASTRARDCGLALRSVRYSAGMHSEVRGPGAQRQRRGFDRRQPRNRGFRAWLISLALVLLAALAGFAIYAGLWHSGGSSGSDHKRALVYAQELLAAQCTAHGEPCRMKSLTEVLPGIWRARMAFGDGSVPCADIKLDAFQPRGSQSWLGVAPC